tara:strand:- start:699 stop:818 length:120 start_codon:yes stop_codon:yes gene_type:complete
MGGSSLALISLEEPQEFSLLRKTVGDLKPFEVCFLGVAA